MHSRFLVFVFKIKYSAMSGDHRVVWVGVGSGSEGGLNMMSVRNGKYGF